MASRSQMPMIKWKLGMCLTKALISSSNILFRLSSLLLFCVKSAFFLSSLLLLSLFSFSSFSNSANCKQHFNKYYVCKTRWCNWTIRQTIILQSIGLISVNKKKIILWYGGSPVLIQGCCVRYEQMRSWKSEPQKNTS